MMVRGYWKNLSASLTEARFYIWASQRPWTFTAWFVGLSYLWLGLLVGVRVVLTQTPHFMAQLNHMRDEVIRYYPEKTSLDWNGSVLVITSAEPVTIWYPEILKGESNMPDHLGLLVPYEITPDKISTLSSTTLYLVTPTHLYINTPEVTLDRPLSEFDFVPPFHLTPETASEVISNWFAQIATGINNIKWFVVVLMPFGLFIGRVVTGFIEFIFVILLLKLNQLKASVSQSIKLSLHLFVTAELLTQFALTIRGVELPLPLFMVAFWSMLIYVVIRWQQTK